jgi:DNA-directed RNA polymerase sigma subunit (sigma70/sigma32)
MPKVPYSVSKINKKKPVIYDYCDEVLGIVPDGSLSDRELDIIRCRIGGVTLRELGLEFGVTHERIRQIEYKVIRKLLRFGSNNGMVFNLQ